MKHITTGEGGAVVTSNVQYYERLVMFRTMDYARSDKLIARMRAVAPGDALSSVELSLDRFAMRPGPEPVEKLDLFVKKRREIVHRYNAAFKDNPG